MGGEHSSGGSTFDNDCNNYEEDDDDNYEEDPGGKNDDAIRLALLHIYRAFWEVNTRGKGGDSSFGGASSTKRVG